MAQSSNGKDIGRITIQKLSITIEWKIYNYFALSPKIGKNYFSPSFNFLDAKWYLQLLPNGESDSVDWMVLYLHRGNSVKEIHDIHFTLGIRTCDDNTYDSQSTTCIFDDDNDAHGTKIVLKTSLLENADKIAPLKHLTIFCVFYEKDHELDSSSVCSEDPDVFSKDMKNLLVSERFCDVKILVKGKELQAHKAILAARSSVFSANFVPEMTEKKSSIVEILDCEFDVFKEFLHYLYTGKLQEVSEINFCELYVLADKYDVKQLKGECIAIMKRSISVDNFCDIISLAMKFNESELLKKAIDYFLKNTKNILLTVNWLFFMAEAPAVANDLILKLVT